MKIKKGRIFIKKIRNKNKNLSEVNTKSQIIIKKIFTVNNRCRLKIDPRPVSDKSYIYSCILEVTFFLKKNNFDMNFTQNFFLKPTNRDFFYIFSFLIKKIDLNIKFEKKFEENMPFLLKMIKYPFFICKSYFFSIASPHTWPFIISCLKWMTELLSYQNILEKKEILEIFPFFQKKIFWNEMSVAYHKNLVQTKNKFQQIIWAYFLYKVREKKFLIKRKKNKLTNLQKKLNFFKQIISLYLDIKKKNAIKKKLIKTLFYLYKSINSKVKLFIFNVNLNIRHYYCKKKRISNQFQIKKKIEEANCIRMKMIESKFKYNIVQMIENNYFKFFKFFKNLKKLGQILKLFKYLKNLLFKINLILFVKNFSCISKEILNFFFTFIFKILKKKKYFNLNKPSLLLNKNLKNFQTKILMCLYIKRLLNDKIEDLFFLLRKKKLCLDIKLFKLNKKYKKKKLLYRLNHYFVYIEGQKFNYFYFIFYSFLFIMYSLLKFNFTQIIIFKFRYLQSINFLSHNKIFY